MEALSTLSTQRAGAPVLERESAYGAAATRQKVRWYQTILKAAGGFADLAINGDHNDPETRAALRQFQRFYRLKESGYLEVDSDFALTQLALEWIYRTSLPNRKGTLGDAYGALLRRFQTEYGLAPDGQVGPLTREKMMAVLKLAGRQAMLEIDSLFSGTLTRKSHARPAEGFTLEETSSPGPARFYRIQYGKGGLLKTVSRAYGVPLQPNPIGLAQHVNDHPYNRRFWRSPMNAWERLYFPDGIIDFNPRFTRSFSAQHATPPNPRAPKGGSFAVIWLPDRVKSYLQHSHVTELPGAFIDSTEPPQMPLLPDAFERWKGICDRRPSFRNCTNAPGRFPFRGPARPPNGWVCQLFAFEPNPSGKLVEMSSASGVLIRPNIVLTAGHVVRHWSQIRNPTNDQVVWVRDVKAFYLLVVPGRAGVDYDHVPRDPLGAFGVDLNAAPSRVKISPEWSNLIGNRRRKKEMLRLWRLNPDSIPRIDPGIDYALINLKGATRFGGASFKNGSFGTPFKWGTKDELSGSSVIGEGGITLRTATTGHLVGYPSDWLCEQVLSPGEITRLRRRNIHVAASTAMGNSGGPFWIDREIVNGGVKTRRVNAVGILSSGSEASCSRCGRIEAMRPQLNKWLKAWGEPPLPT